jgi:broad specificity phosphatase PhoE
MTIETKDQTPRSPTRVWLLRHGESAVPTVFHGAESDVDLSERGRKQAAAVAPVLASYRPDAVISSAMRRAVATATPIAAACGLPLRQVPELHERRVGALSGTPFAVSEGIWAETFARWVAGDTGFAPPGAESLDDLRERLLPVWHRLTEEHAGRSLVIVAHGVVCKVLLVSLVTGLGVADWRRLGPVRNVGVTELVGGAQGWTMVRYNEMVGTVAEQ